MFSEGKKEQNSRPIFPNMPQNPPQSFFNGFSINPFFDFQKQMGDKPFIKEEKKNFSHPFEKFIDEQSKKGFVFFEPNQEKGNPFLIVPKKEEQKEKEKEKEKEEGKREPAKEEGKREPGKEEGKREPAKEEGKREPAKEEEKREPGKEEGKREPAKEEEKREPAKEEEDEDSPPKKSKVKEDIRPYKRGNKKIKKVMLKNPYNIKRLGDQLEMAAIAMEEIEERKNLFDFLEKKIEQAGEDELNNQNTTILNYYNEKKSVFKKMFKK